MPTLPYLKRKITAEFDDNLHHREPLNSLIIALMLFVHFAEV